MPDEVKRQILRLELDQAANRQLLTGVSNTTARISGLRAEIGLVKKQFDISAASTGKYGGEAQRVTRRADELRATMRAVREEVKKTDNVFARARAARQFEEDLRNINQQAQAVGRVESGVRGATSLFGTLGADDLEKQFNIGADVLNAAQGFQTLRAELPELISNLDISAQGIAVMGAAVVIAGGAALLAKGNFDKIAKGSREAQVATVGLIEGLRSFYEFQQDATAEDARARFDTLAAQRQANGLLLQDLVKVKLAIEQGLDVSDEGALETFAEASLRVLDAAGLASTGLDEINAAIKQTDTEAKALDTEMGLLVKGLNDGAFAANDAAAAAERLAAAEKTLNDERYDTLLRGTQVQIQATQLSQEQIDNRLEQIAIEREAYQRLYSGLEAIQGTTIDYSAELEQTEKTLARLTQEEEILNQARSKVRPEVAALTKLHEDSISIFDASKKAFAATVAEADKYAETVAKRQQQLLQTAQKRALQLAQDEEEASLDRSRKVADHYADLADIDRKFYEDRGEILKDAIADLDANQQERADELVSLNKDLERLAGEHSRNMRRIARDAQRDEIRAARNLDAVALADAKTARKDAIEDENDQYDDEKKAREDQFQERLDLLDRERRETLDNQQQALRDLEAQHRRERAENERAFAEELRREDEDRRIKLAHQQQQWALEDQQQRQQWALEDAQRRNAFSVQTSQTSAHMNNINAITNTGLAQVESRFASSMTKLAASTVVTTSAVTRSGSTATSRTRATLTAYADGGYPPVGRDVLVGERGPEIARFMMPTRIYPAGVNPGSRGGSLSEGAIQINIYGSTSPQLTARAVRQQVEGILAEYWR